MEEGKCSLASIVDLHHLDGKYIGGKLEMRTLLWDPQTGRSGSGIWDS
jgi:hypothetical protein